MKIKIVYTVITLCFRTPPSFHRNNYFKRLKHVFRTPFVFGHPLSFSEKIIFSVRKHGVITVRVNGMPLCSSCIDGDMLTCRVLLSLHPTTSIVVIIMKDVLTTWVDNMTQVYIHTYANTIYIRGWNTKNTIVHS